MKEINHLVLDYHDGKDNDIGFGYSTILIEFQIYLDKCLQNS